MSVDTVPAPPATARPAPPPEDRVHTGLFWLAIVAVVIGALVVGASRVWADKASTMVTFPVFDHTAEMSGSVVLHVDAATLAPLPAPAGTPLTDTRRTQTPSLLANHAVLVSTDTFSTGGKQAVVAAQYVLDVQTLHQVATPQAWSFVGTNQADRSGAYAINLPFDTGPGPYQIWLNEAGRAYAFTQVGQPFLNDGVTVIRLRGQLDSTPVDPAFVTDMARAGLPAGAALQKVRPEVASFGVPSGLSGSEVAELIDPIPLDYTVTAATGLLVEPRTGTIVAVEAMDESFSARLDGARLDAISAMLASHRAAPGVAQMRAAVASLATAPAAAVYDLRYAQTAASVQTLSAYAATQRDWVNRMTRVIPTALLATGIGLAGAGILAGVVAWRRRDTEFAQWWEQT